MNETKAIKQFIKCIIENKRVTAKKYLDAYVKTNLRTRVQNEYNKQLKK